MWMGEFIRWLFLFEGLSMFITGPILVFYPKVCLDLYG
jgi:hypothetical protein